MKKRELEKGIKSFMKECVKHYGGKIDDGKGITMRHDDIVRNYVKYKDELGLIDISSEIISDGLAWWYELNIDRFNTIDIIEILNNVDLFIETDNYLEERSKENLYKSYYSVLLDCNTARLVNHKDIVMEEDKALYFSVDIVWFLSTLSNVFELSFTNNHKLNQTCILEAIKKWIEKDNPTKIGKKKVKTIISILLEKDKQPQNFKRILQKRDF